MDNTENLKQWLSEILDIETSDVEINEYVDWTTGINEITGARVQGIDDNTKISGKAIRRFIQKKLQNPFVTEADSTAGKIRFFSSEATKNLYKNYMTLGDELSIQKANDLLLFSMDMPATYRITGMDGFVSARYIIEGNELSNNANLEINLGLEDSLGSTDSDVLTVSYQVIDNTGNTQYSSSDQIETNRRIVKNIYRYLRSGENKVTVTAVANNHNARVSKTFSIYLVTFSIDTNFTGYYTPIANNTPFSFDIFISRSITNLPVVTTVTIDGSIAHQNDANRSQATWEYGENSANPTKRMEIYNSYSSSTDQQKVKHILTVQARMQDAETGTDFPSNILTYEFEIAPSRDDLTWTYINIASSTSSGSLSNVNFIDVDGQTRILPLIKSTQYLPTTINWGYNTDSFSRLLEANVEWAIRTGTAGNYTYETVANIRGVKNEKPETLTFIPASYSNYDENSSYLVARIDNEDAAIYPIQIERSTMSISEYGNYSLKLSAYGKTNTSSNRSQWIDEANNVYTDFSPGVTFDNSNGWNNNSLVLKGTSSYALIDYCPFPSTYNGVQYSVSNSGATFEIDFKPEYVSSESDILITIGDQASQHIRICATSAGFYTGNTAVIKTNYKAGERIKLAFIFNRASGSSNASNLIYIVNNGILERAIARGSANLTNDLARIKLGGSNSSVRIYMIRAYRQDLSPKQALDNYMFDNASDVNLLSRNDIYGSSATVTYTGMQGKQDLIVIEGDLTNILSNKSTKENATVNIRRESSVDSARNFTIENCRIRNHGQSTLSYPITSMKIWLNKSNKFDEQTGTLEIVPTFNCQSQQYLGLNKNRYIFKQGAIPSNKFVLQANYADSSGTHNGSLLRLIHNTWYNAQFGQDKQFKLRTAPQLFASGAKITHDNASLNEDGSWVEGYYNIPDSSPYYVEDYANKTWPEITSRDFPYQIRVAPDSFPCTIFYRDTSTSNQNLTLLGQYVFMDDKKSDFVYGERSIYYTDDLSDPFCLRTENSKKDKNANKVWDNGNVLQIEVVYPNSPLTAYTSKTIASSYHLDENDELQPDDGATLVRFDAVTARDANNNPIEYQWEQHFELIYPDKEDIIDSNGNFDSAKFTQTIAPFEDFLEWITDVAALKSTGARLGQTGSKSQVTQAEMDKFIAEAHDHLDLYKLAAYYVFVLRFGLVDSVERNAQLKTYDGQHWHYEPWDMDIALGCANNGVIAYEPPLTRDSKTAGGAYVFAGRTAGQNNSISQSNVLWDCLESWDYWANTIVHEVAQALYDAGLTYENAIRMFDGEYVEKWSETLYNESGQYKYIDATSNAKYRQYLNGARTSHRHWWLSKSMNYYDAKWECGDFTKNTIEFRLYKPSAGENTNVVVIYPTQNTFFAMAGGAEGNRTSIGGGLTEAGVAAGQEAHIDISGYVSGDKQPTFIYGATSIEKLDMSAMLSTGNYYTDIDFGGAYDATLGASIKELRLGAKCDPDIYTTPNNLTYTSNLSIGQNDISGLSDTNNDALENLEILDVIGWKSTNNASGWLSNLMSEKGHDRKNIHTLYAMGCTMATEFATSTLGNNFRDLRLPNSITTLTFTNSTWDSLTFWSSTNLTINTARHEKVAVPATIESIFLKGSTGQHECSLQLVLDWIDSIEATLPVGHTEEDLYEVLSTKVLVVDQAHWGTGTIRLSYRDALRLGHFGSDGSLHPLKGYILLQSDETGMTSTRVTLLQQLFGDNVFNIGTTNANLVVDYQNEQIVISIIGIEESLTVDGNDIQIKEPNSARLRANHFLLSSGENVNEIADNDTNNPSVTNNLTENKFIWGFVNSASEPIGTMQSQLPYARLEKGNDGIIRLYTSEGNGNNYTMYIRVVYGKVIGNSVQPVQDTITVKVKGVTYPTDYIWSVVGTGDITKFNYTTSIAQQLFGNSLALNIGANADIYVLRAASQRLEFIISPAEPKSYIDSNTGREVINWTANPNNETIRYSVSERGNASGTSSNTLTSQDKSVFQANTGVPMAIGMCTYVYALDDSTRGGIPLQASSNDPLPSSPVLFQVNASIKIGGKDTITKTIYFIAVNDATPIIEGSQAALSRCMWDKYCALYSLQTGAAQNMYKTHLLSVYGTVDFSPNDYKTVNSLVTSNNDSVLKYIPNVTILNFEGCTSLGIQDTNHYNNFDFTQSSNLTSLNLKGCTGLNGQYLDLRPCANLTTLDTRNTSIGVLLGNATTSASLKTKISTLHLGSPIKLVIDGATVLGQSNTTFDIQSSSNLTELQLNGINDTAVKGYTLFDTIYNPQ